ncbi:MAG: signal peptide peptidase SppA [Eggerthellaceae bacterium]
MSNQNPNIEPAPVPSGSSPKPDESRQPGVAPQATGAWRTDASASAGKPSPGFGAATAPGGGPAPVHPYAAIGATGGSSAAAVAAKPLSSKKGNAPLLVTILLLVLLIVAGIGSCVSGSTAGNSSISLGDRVAVITLDGTIQYDGSACSPEGFKMLLDEAENDPSIKAVVLRVNSGGGTATAGEEMAEYLKDFEKPVVVSTAAINASAAYEISSQADYIFAAKSSEVGSIGTIIELMDYSDLFEMLGIDVDTISSADSKDSSYGIRALTDEEREHYQQMVDEINQMFIENVAEGRGVSEQKVASEWANGLTWAGATAQKMGLVDEIGTLEDACDKAAGLAGCEDSYETTELYFAASGIESLLGSL